MKKNTLSILMALFFPILALFKLNQWPLSSFPMYSEGVPISTIFKIEIEINSDNKTMIPMHKIPRQLIYALYKCRQHQITKECLGPIFSYAKSQTTIAKEIKIHMYKFAIANNQWIEKIDATYESNN